MKKVRIVKVPLEKGNFKQHRLKFPRLPKLYLEIIENKDKIKPELYDVEFDDSKYQAAYDVESPQTPPPVHRHLSKAAESEEKPATNSPPTPPTPKETKDPKARLFVEDTPSTGESYKRKATKKHETPPRSETRREKRKEDVDLDKHLDDLLKASNEKKAQPRAADKYRQKDFDVTPSQFNKYAAEDAEEDAPSLSELRRRGFNIPKNMRNASNFDESDEDKKRELLLKIRMLRKYYPESELPEFSAYSSYGELKNTYDDTFRSLSIDSQVNSYERYIIMFSYGLEIVAGRFLKFDMQGFTKHQLQNINEYKRLLIELGEKSYSPGGSSFPVEVRLLFICLQQMALFLLMKSTGMGNLMGMLSSLGSEEKKGKVGMAPPKFN